MKECLLCGNSKPNYYDLALIFDHKPTIALGKDYVALCPDCYEHLCNVKLIAVPMTECIESVSLEDGFDNYINRQIDKARIKGV